LIGFSCRRVIPFTTPRGEGYGDFDYTIEMTDFAQPNCERGDICSWR